VSSAARWYILGAGAMGALFGGSMRQAGVDSRLLTHRDQPRTLRWVDEKQTTHLEAAPLHTLAPRSIRRLLLTTKAFAVCDALRLAEPYLAADALVVSCANGMGFETRAEEILGGRPLLRAVTTEAALRTADSVAHTGRGATRIGDGRAQPGPWFSDSLARVPRWYWEPDIDQAIANKFAINCAINALTARHGCRNGALLENSAYRLQLETLCDEIQQVMTALQRWTPGVSLRVMAGQVCTATAANRSSMLQDKLAGRRTELAFLNGHLLELARELGVAAPENAALCAALVP